MTFLESVVVLCSFNSRALIPAGTLILPPAKSGGGRGGDFCVLDNIQFLLLLLLLLLLFLLLLFVCFSLFACFCCCSV